MTSKHDTETNLESGSTEHPRRSAPASSENAYHQLTGYGFTRRYIRGKIVADVSWEEIGYGSRLLAETAEFVAGLTNSPEAVDLASAAYSAPNISYQRVNLPELPYSQGYFDVVVVFGVVENLEHPEDLVREAKRVLKQDGVLVVSTLDKQTNANNFNPRSIESQREMYVLEFRELLEHYFGHVHVYRQGAVAGGFVFPAFEEVTGTPVESARFSLNNPDLGTEPPTIRSIVAVCSDTEVPEQEKHPYLLLDRDRCLFNECEEHAEDVGLMRDEIRQMQETEVQAFADALRVQQSLAQVLRRYPIHAVNIIYGNIYAIRRKGTRDLIRGAYQRLRSVPRHLFGLYRRP